jgi:hypothetical protein
VPGWHQRQAGARRGAVPAASLVELLRTGHVRDFRSAPGAGALDSFSRVACMLSLTSSRSDREVKVEHAGASAVAAILDAGRCAAAAAGQARRGGSVHSAARSAQRTRAELRQGQAHVGPQPSRPSPNDKPEMM